MSYGARRTHVDSDELYRVVLKGTRPDESNWFLVYGPYNRVEGLENGEN